VKSRGHWVVGEEGDLNVPAIQGIADHEVPEPTAGGRPAEEDAPIAGVADAPALEGVLGEEGEAEVRGLREGAGGRGGARSAGASGGARPAGARAAGGVGRRAAGGGARAAGGVGRRRVSSRAS